MEEMGADKTVGFNVEEMAHTRPPVTFSKLNLERSAIFPPCGFFPGGGGGAPLPFLGNLGKGFRQSWVLYLYSLEAVPSFFFSSCSLLAM